MASKRFGFPQPPPWMDELARPNNPKRALPGAGEGQPVLSVRDFPSIYIKDDPSTSDPPRALLRLADLHTITPGVVGGLQHVWREIGDGLIVLASLDRATPHTTWNKPLLHISVSHATRLPTWGEMRALKDLFYGPDVDACMILPRSSDYINTHPFCLHLYQLPVSWGIR